MELERHVGGTGSRSGQARSWQPSCRMGCASTHPFVAPIGGLHAPMLRVLDGTRTRIILVRPPRQRLVASISCTLASSELGRVQVAPQADRAWRGSPCVSGKGPAQWAVVASVSSRFWFVVAGFLLPGTEKREGGGGLGAGTGDAGPAPKALRRRSPRRSALASGVVDRRGGTVAGAAVFARSCVPAVAWRPPARSSIPGGV